MRRWKLVFALMSSLVLALSACDRAAVESSPPEKGEAQAAEKPAAAVERVPLIGAKIKGSDRAPVTIVEISDYACPFCKRAHTTVESLVGEYHGRVRLAVFENPLPFHTRAKPAAKWAFAAGEQ